MTGCAEQGPREEGRAQVHQGLTGLQATGAELARPYILAMLAEESGKLRQAGEGLSLLTKALAAVERTDERWCEAELHRLKGELTLQQESQKPKACPEPFDFAQDKLRRRVKAQKSKVPNPKSQILDPSSEAEACFLKAIDISRMQQAKSLELRASMSLARLWQQQGKQHEAHRMLSEIYGWFTEGLDTADLQEAKGLLNELA
jgi:predicted ATPase